MITYPNAKINLGLRVLGKREDGFHEIQTVMVPVPLFDVLEVGMVDQASYKSHLEHTSFASKYLMPAHTQVNIGSKMNFVQTNAPSGLDPKDNLCMKAVRLFKEETGINSDNLYMHLIKKIPHGAGLGGGSADAAFTLLALNEIFDQGLSVHSLKKIAVQLGSDCAFFIDNVPSVASGRGELLDPVSLDLKYYTIVIVKPQITINTAWAYSKIIPDNQTPLPSDVIKLRVVDWRKNLINDFEKPLFREHPELEQIKDDLYKRGAVYASLTGSGAALYGIFNPGDELNVNYKEHFMFKSGLEN